MSGEGAAIDIQIPFIDLLFVLKILFAPSLFIPLAGSDQVTKPALTFPPCFE